MNSKEVSEILEPIITKVYSLLGLSLGYKQAMSIRYVVESNQSYFTVSNSGDHSVKVSDFKEFLSQRGISLSRNELALFNASIAALYNEFCSYKNGFIQFSYGYHSDLDITFDWEFGYYYNGDETPNYIKGKSLVDCTGDFTAEIKRVADYNNARYVYDENEMVYKRVN